MERMAGQYTRSSRATCAEARLDACMLYNRGEDDATALCTKHIPSSSTCQLGYMHIACTMAVFSSNHPKQ